jgi:hypothetical protein
MNAVGITFGGYGRSASSYIRIACSCFFILQAVAGFHNKSLPNI